MVVAGDEQVAISIAAPASPVVPLGDWIVEDTRTGLLWASRDNWGAIGWGEAVAYCSELEVGNRSGWRVPTLDELETLYSADHTARCGVHICHVEPPIELSACCHWSSVEDGPIEAWFFNFMRGKRQSWPKVDAEHARVVCVLKGDEPD